MPEVVEEFEDNKGAIRIRISKKDRRQNGHKKKHKAIYKSMHRKLKIE
jgi:hypothetical protein